MFFLILFISFFSKNVQINICTTSDAQLFTWIYASFIMCNVDENGGEQTINAALSFLEGGWDKKYTQ